MSRPYYEPPTAEGPMQYVNAKYALTEPWPEQAHNVKLVGQSDLNGWGDAFQIQVGKGICYVAASGVNGHDGFTILDVSDPDRPRVVGVYEATEGINHWGLDVQDNALAYLAVGLEVPAHGAGASREQRDRVLREQRVDGVLPLALQAQRLPAGGQGRQARAGGQ